MCVLEAFDFIKEIEEEFSDFFFFGVISCFIKGYSEGSDKDLKKRCEKQVRNQCYKYSNIFSPLKLSLIKFIRLRRLKFLITMKRF